MTAISVVMGVYNNADTLAETIDSILGQSETDFELIVVDDGSTDQTSAILDEYARRDGRLRVIRQTRSGLTGALISGCQAATGRYIARQDAGDISHRLRLKAQSEALDESPEVVFASCWTIFVGPDLEPLYDSRGLPSSARPVSVLDPLAPHGIVDGPTHHGSVMFRRDIYLQVGGYRREFYYGQDWDLWYRMASAGKFLIVQEPLYTARITPASISSLARVAQERIAALASEASRARSRGESDNHIVANAAAIRPEDRASVCARGRGLYFIGEALRRNRDVRCRHYLLQAALACPLLLKAWVRLFQSLALRRLPSNPAPHP